MPVVVDRPVEYTLRDLGHRAPIVLRHDRLLSEQIPYRISREANRRWPYARVVLRFRIELDPDAAPGDGYVDMDTGTGPSASAEFITTRKGGRLHTFWDTVDVHGQKDHRTVETSIAVTYPNHMLYPDSTAGPHRLRFRLEEYRGFRAKRVTISPESSIRLTDRSAYGARASRLSLTARGTDPGVPALGRPLHVAVELRNDGSRTARGVRVRASADRGVRLVRGGVFRGWPDIPPGRSATRTLVVVASTPGRHRIGFSAGSTAGTSSGVARFAVATRSARRGSSDAGVVPYVAGVLAAAAALLLGRLLVRRRTRAP